MAAEGHRVRLVAEALDDLDDIADFVARTRGFDEADLLIERLREHVLRLDRFPMRGPVPKELDRTGRTDIRQAQLGIYRIFYKVEGETVSVFMVADGRRDMEALLGIRLLAADAS